MYNLNYNVTNCRLNKPTGRPFVPYGRPDPYSSSLVVAIPGNIFRQGYVSVFNQTNAFDDISGYLKGGAVFDESIGKYIPAYASYNAEITQSINATGSYEESTLTNFINNGYLNSAFFTGSISVKLNDTALTSSKNGTNLGSGSNWCIETWVAFDITSSIVSQSGAYPTEQFFGAPNRLLIQKYTPGNPSTSSYIGYVGVAMDASFAAEPNLISGSMTFYYSALNTGLIPPIPEEWAIVPTSMSYSQQQPLQFRHYALSYSTGSTPYSAGIFRTYVNGLLQHSQSYDGNAGDIFNIPKQTILFGYDQGDVPSFLPEIAIQNGAYFQDFRMYNGSNKNYTGSIIPLPESMIVGLQEPYPVYNP